ncbi:MAG: alpha/beta fold hydrolase [Gammaproteobacteria bacterium]
MGGGIALEIAIRYPHRMRKLVFAAATYNPDGFHPGILQGIDKLTPQDFAGSPWLEAYTKIAPNPNGWPRLLARVQGQARAFRGWSPEVIRSIKAPTLIMVGDSDVVRPEHAVQLFRLLGGGVAGDIVGLPRSQLAVLPGTTHVTLADRADWLVSMVTQFLDAPMPKAR